MGSRRALPGGGNGVCLLRDDGGGRRARAGSGVGPGVVYGLGIGEKELPVVSRAEELPLLRAFPLGEGVPPYPELHLAVGALEAVPVEVEPVGRHALHQVHPLVAEVAVVTALTRPGYLGQWFGGGGVNGKGIVCLPLRGRGLSGLGGGRVSGRRSLGLLSRRLGRCGWGRGLLLGPIGLSLALLLGRVFAFL